MREIAEKLSLKEISGKLKTLLCARKGKSSYKYTLYPVTLIQNREEWLT